MPAGSATMPTPSAMTMTAIPWPSGVTGETHHVDCGYNIVGL